MTSSLEELRDYVQQNLESKTFPVRHPDQLFAAFRKYRVSLPKPVEVQWENCKQNINYLINTPEKVKILEQKALQFSPRKSPYKGRGRGSSRYRGRGSPSYRGRGSPSRRGRGGSSRGRGNSNGEIDGFTLPRGRSSYSRRGRGRQRRGRFMDERWRTIDQKLTLLEKKIEKLYNKEKLEPDGKSEGGGDRHDNQDAPVSREQQLNGRQQESSEVITVAACEAVLNSTLVKLQRVNKMVKIQFERESIKREENEIIPKSVSPEMVMKVQKEAFNRVMAVAKKAAEMGVPLHLDSKELHELHNQYQSILNRIELLEAKVESSEK